MGVGARHGDHDLAPRLAVIEHDLRERGFVQLFVVGLATDFCVAYSALDGRRLGFEVTVIEESCCGIDVGGSLDAAWRQMDEAGVVRA